jgi:hypothetical protein
LPEQWNSDGAIYHTPDLQPVGNIKNSQMARNSTRTLKPLLEQQNCPHANNRKKLTAESINLLQQVDFHRESVHITCSYASKL